MPKSLNGAYYSCQVVGTCSTVSSNTGYLYVNGVDKPIITANFDNPAQPYLAVNNVFGDNYEWFLNGNSHSSGTSNLYISEPGSYTVIVSWNGCVSEESDAKAIIITGIEAVEKGITMYPNPVRDNLIVRIAQWQKNMEIRVYTVEGKLKIRQSVQTHENTVDTRGLPKGIYMLQIIDDVQSRSFRIIKSD